MIKYKIILVTTLIFANFVGISAQSTDTCFTYKKLIVVGNKKTKLTVFEREIGANLGQSFCNINQQKQIWTNRISSLSLFNYVELKTVVDTLFVQVKERLYIWGYPEFNVGDRNWNVFFKHPAWNRLTYGIYGNYKNIFGLNHTLELAANTGYNNFFSVAYKMPFSQYNKGISLQVKYAYLSNHEAWYQTENNILKFYKISDRIAQKYQLLNVKLQKRINYFNSINLYVGGMLQYVDTAVTGTTGNSDYFLQGNKQNTGITGIEWISDHRNQRDYPVSGYYIVSRLQPEIRQSENKSRSNLEFYFKSNWFTPIKPNLVWVLGMITRISGEQLPYNSRRQLGYGQDYVRGYEPYVVDGNRFVLGKTALRYAALNNYKFEAPKWLMPLKNYRTIPISIWCSIFADAGKTNASVSSLGNSLTNTWLRSSGIGLDVLFAYNAMMRIEYSINHFKQGQFNLAFTNAF